MRAAQRLRSLARIAGIGLLVVVVCVAAILMGLHTPWVQARVVRWVTSRLETQGIVVQSKTLSYNLATLSVHGEGLVVSTAADRLNPFFEAARVDVAVPRSVLRGQFSLSSL